MVFTVSMGMRSTFGVYFKSIESDFGLTRGATSGIFSLYMLLCVPVSIMSGWVLDRYGPRMVTFLMGSTIGLSLLLASQTSAAWQLYISYGLLLALGTGGTFPLVTSTVSRWFYKKRGLALGIVTSGGGLGPVILAPFATYLISNFSWRMALVVTGLIAWFIIASLSLLMRKDPGDMGLLPDGAKSPVAQTGLHNEKDKTQLTGMSFMQAFRTRNFWLLGLVWLFLSFNVHMILTHIVPHATDIGISPMDVAIVVSVMGGVSILGRLALGRIPDAAGSKLPAITCAILLVGALLWLTWSNSLWMFYVFAVLFGFVWGGLSTAVTALVGDIFGVRSIGTILGAVNAGWSLGGAIGPAVAGFTFDASGSYFIAFATGAVAMLLATFFVSLIRRENYVRNEQQ
ncbi:MFS transporter [Chloroflexota bacterium]